MSGARTLKQTEDAANGRLAGLDLDFDAMTAMTNLHRVTSAARNHFEQSVLKNADLTWTAFVVLWVVWIFESIETRHVAAESGITKGTLTGVVRTLERRGLVQREIPPDDKRRMLLSVTTKGSLLMTDLFPAVNEEEQFVLANLSRRRTKELGSTLRRIITHLEEDGEARENLIRGRVD